MKTIKLRVEENGLLDVPNYRERRNAKNWAATVGADPLGPGGLTRTFWERGRGFFYYVVPRDIALRVPCVVEFGADYVTKTTLRSVTNRWYGLLIEVKANELTIIECYDARAAFGLLDKMRREALDAPK